VSVYEQVAADIANRMREDMRGTLNDFLGYERSHTMMLEELVDEAMVYVQHLLIQSACDEQREKIDHE
jgi:hypothetical protein